MRHRDEGDVGGGRERWESCENEMCRSVCGREDGERREKKVGVFVQVNFGWGATEQLYA
jgi:hypothetical protein